jgi:predicted TPR repeat methyltransferase
MPDKDFLKRAYQLKSKDETEALYDDWADVYDTQLIDEGGYAMPRRCAETVAVHISDRDAPILDVGCGTGLSGAALKTCGFTNLDGNDLSAGMLEKARGKEIYNRLFKADLTAPPMDVEDNTYAAAVAVGVLSFGHLGPQALEDILRVVRPGGIVVVGLNEVFYGEGHFEEKVTELESAGGTTVVSREKGLHIPAEEIEGWVIVLKKN